MELDYAFHDPYADSRVRGRDIHSDYGYGEHCCPLVVDTICVAAIVFSIAGASLLLARVIQIEIDPPRIRKRSLLFGSQKYGKLTLHKSVIQQGMKQIWLEGARVYSMASRMHSAWLANFKKCTMLKAKANKI